MQLTLLNQQNLQNDWKTVVNQWQAAIALMKNVPSSSSNYGKGGWGGFFLPPSQRRAQKKLLLPP
ncbi:hypothetical protein FM036_46180 [Nostoc sp. HG1]|nr:hypothetical protein [Nostoc sp. HG1]